MNKKSRYGESMRLYHDNDLYIIGSSKMTPIEIIPEPSIPYLYFYRTVKTAKQKGLRGDKYDIAHRLEGKTFNSEIIKKLLNCFDQYLKQWKPRYICHGAYEDNREKKRFELYANSLQRLGYKLIKKDFNNDLCVYYYERIWEQNEKLIADYR